MPAEPTQRLSASVRDWRAILAVLGVAFASSLTGIANNYAQDDLYLVFTNERVHGLGRWYELLTSPFWPPPYSQDLYRPLTSLLHAFEYTIGSGSPIVYRLVSYTLLAATALQLFAFARRIMPRGAALCAALLFAAHPVHVEATALATGQAELVVGFIALLMATRYLDARRAGALTAREWLIQGALYLAAGLTKEQGYILPGLLLAVELCLIRGSLRERIRMLGRGYAGLAVVLALMLAARRSVLGGDVVGTFTAEALVGLGIGGRALTMLRVVPEWLRLLAWPAHLQGDYSPQEIVASTHVGAMEWLGIAIVVAAVVIATVAWRRAPAVTLGLAWCAITLFPVSNVIVPTGIVLAERTLFLPSAGFILAVVAAVGMPWGRGAVRTQAQLRALGMACGALMVLGVLRSARRQFDWQNEPVYAIRTRSDAPGSFRAQRGFGDLMFALDRPAEAIEAYERAIALSPPALAWRVRNNLATQLRQRGERVREISELRQSLASEPGQPDTRAYLVTALLATGRYADAAAECDSAIVQGMNRANFTQLKATADSAERVHAPPGSIDIRIVREGMRPVR